MPTRSLRQASGGQQGSIGAFACSVIIPTYNHALLLSYTLESLTRQTLDRPFEVFVVDDGSSDGSRDVVDRYRDALSVRYFFQEDDGFRVASARNIGVAAAASESVCSSTPA